jgi:hypothetical protein
VRGAGAIFGGIVAVPAALKGTVELALLIDAGDITGAGADLFKAGVGKAMSVAAARRLVAREARIVAERETRVVLKKLARTKAFMALSQAEREQVQRIVYWEKQRELFRGYLQAARAEQRVVRQARKKARPAERAALEARQTAASTGEEIARAEPVAGRLPRNHAYAGHEYPRSELPTPYRNQGLTFKPSGYPDFEPYAKVLPNGEKKVHIACTGSRRADFAAADRAAKLEDRRLDPRVHGRPSSARWVAQVEQAAPCDGPRPRHPGPVPCRSTRSPSAHNSPVRTDLRLSSCQPPCGDPSVSLPQSVQRNSLGQDAELVRARHVIKAIASAYEPALLTARG